MRRLKRKSIKRFRRFKPQALQASSFKTDSVRQPCTVLVQGQLADRQNDNSRAVIPDLIRNLSQCQGQILSAG